MKTNIFFGTKKALCILIVVLTGFNNLYAGTENDLFSHKIPWINSSFLWPEKNISWNDEKIYDGSISKTISHNAVLDSGYIINVCITNLSFRITPFNRRNSYENLRLDIYYSAHSNFKSTPYVVTEDIIEDNSYRFRYEYDCDGITILGLTYCTFPDSYRLLSVACEYYERASTDVTEIVKSLGF